MIASRQVLGARSCRLVARANAVRGYLDKAICGQCLCSLGGRLLQQPPCQHSGYLLRSEVSITVVTINMIPIPSECGAVRAGPSMTSMSHSFVPGSQY